MNKITEEIDNIMTNSDLSDDPKIPSEDTSEGTNATQENKLTPTEDIPFESLQPVKTIAQGRFPVYLVEHVPSHLLLAMKVFPFNDQG